MDPLQENALLARPTLSKADSILSADRVSDRAGYLFSKWICPGDPACDLLSSDECHLREVA